MTRVMTKHAVAIGDNLKYSNLTRVMTRVVLLSKLKNNYPTQKRIPVIHRYKTIQI